MPTALDSYLSLAAPVRWIIPTHSSTKKGLGTRPRPQGVTLNFCVLYSHSIFISRTQAQEQLRRQRRKRFALQLPTRFYSFITTFLVRVLSPFLRMKNTPLACLRRLAFAFTRFMASPMPLALNEPSLIPCMSKTL